MLTEPDARGQVPKRALKIQGCQDDLLLIIGALNTSGRFAGRLNCRQQQRNQDRNVGDHY
jgi:hypothetical protein